VEYGRNGVRVVYRPVRTPGDVIALSRTNRDFLGLIRAIGPDEASVRAEIGRFRAENRWEIVS
jgi:hypothetical protein